MRSGSRMGLWSYLDATLKRVRELRGFRSSGPPGPASREVWSPEARALYRTTVQPVVPQPMLLPVTAFSRRLREEIDHAAAAQSPLVVAVFHVPEFTTQLDRRRRELEIALRLEIRREDLAGWLADQMLAVTLLNTREAERLTERLTAVLARLTGEAIASGRAVYPQDGQTAMELLRVATWRSLTSTPQTQPHPEMERLLGPLSPERPARGSGTPSEKHSAG